MKRKRTWELIGAVIGNVFGLLFVNLWIIWQPWTYGVVQESWADILWAANLSLTVEIIGNLLLILVRPAQLYSLAQAVFTAVGLVSLAVFYAVFPLDFSHLAIPWLNTLVRIAMIVGMVGMCIAFVVHMGRVILGTEYSSD